MTLDVLGLCFGFFMLLLFLFKKAEIKDLKNVFHKFTPYGLKNGYYEVMITPQPWHGNWLLYEVLNLRTDEPYTVVFNGHLPQTFCVRKGKITRWDDKKFFSGYLVGQRVFHLLPDSLHNKERPATVANPITKVPPGYVPILHERSFTVIIVPADNLRPLGDYVHA